MDTPSRVADKLRMARILAVDDEPVVLEFLRTALTRDGHEVVKASDGKQVSKIHAESPVDLIITDLFMPERDGLQTIFELRDRFPDLPIIAISGGGMSGQGSAHDMLRVASQLGAQVLEKPFGRARLLEAVDAALPSRLPLA